MKIAFSTIACPSWTLSDAVSKAAEYGYLGLEMRSFHDHRDQALRVASDPLAMDPDEIASLFDDAGIDGVSFATSVRYDKPINPPVIGRIFQNEEAGVSETKEYVDLADRSGVEFVRVFGCNLPAAESRACSLTRVSNRLKLAAQTARNTKARVLLENAGSFARSTEFLSLLELVDSQWLGASFNVLTSQQAGECPIDGIKELGDHLQVIKISDIDADGNPTRLGEGVLPLPKLIEALSAMNYKGWIVYEYPKLWMTSDNGLEVEDVLKHAADTLYEWMQAVPAGG
jgi:sugar phosphate isomerase/epimerase